MLRTRRPASRPPTGRDPPTAVPKQPTMPAWLFEFLVNVIGLSESDVLDMTEDEAMRRYMRHIGGDEPGS